MYPLAGLRLLLPAVVPSWRFFDAVTASPRIDYVVLSSADAAPQGWQEFRPRVSRLSLATMLRRLVWNPAWNENLYLVSLAERLVAPPTPATAAHSERELLRRVARDLHDRQGQLGWLRLRLRFVYRTVDSDEIASEVVYLSDAHWLTALAAA